MDSARLIVDHQWISPNELSCQDEKGNIWIYSLNTSPYVVYDITQAESVGIGALTKSRHHLLLGTSVCLTMCSF